MESLYYQFAPMRTFSAAQATKKSRELTQFVRAYLDRKYFDKENVSINQIVNKVREKCQELDKRYTVKNTFRVTVINTNEWDCKNDYSLKIDIVNDSGEVKQLISLLCFVIEGAMEL